MAAMSLVVFLGVAWLISQAMKALPIDLFCTFVGSRFFGSLLILGSNNLYVPIPVLEQYTCGMQQMHSTYQ